MKSKIFPHILFVLLLAACGPVTSVAQTPTPDFPLPDLAITAAHVSMVDFNGRCLSGYEFIVTVINQGSAPAPNVLLIETGMGHQIQVGTMEPFQIATVSFPAASSNGSYTAIADPQSTIMESDETNNSASFFASTATPPAFCLPAQPADASPTPPPFLPPTPAERILEGLIYADMDLAQIWKISSNGHRTNILDGTDARFTRDALQALLAVNGELLLAEPMDNPGFNITNTPERNEQFPQWWEANPSRIIFISRGNNEAQEKAWGEDVIGYLTMMNKDGGEYAVLADVPSYTAPALSPDGRTIGYDESGSPMLYDVDYGARVFDPTLFGYQPGAEMVFTSPSYSPDGTKLSWWVSENISQPNKRFKLVIFDLTANTSWTLHEYTPLAGTLGWLPNPIWSASGQWIAFQTRGESTAWDLWVMHHGGGMGQRIGLATNPVWDLESLHLAYVQWPPHSDSYLAASAFVVEVPSWNVQQIGLPAGSIPLAWTLLPPPEVVYFPMFTAPGDWLTHSNANPPYQIQYPPNAILEAFPERLTIRMPFQSGTQMVDKSIVIETRADTIDNCYAFSPWEGKTLLNGFDLKYYGGKYWETSSDSNRFLGGNYAVYKGGFCFTMQLRMAAFGALSPLPVPSREDMDVEILLDILSTLQIY